MAFKIIITEDFENMSRTAAGLLIPRMTEATTERGIEFNLGLATGNSPTRLYELIAKSQRQGKFDATKVSTWNLDEYIGLPGDTPEEKEQHPESYKHFMEENLFAHLNPHFNISYVPKGTEIDQERLEGALKEAKEVTLEGTNKGKAVIIPKHCDNPYLAHIRDNLMQAYIQSIKDSGAIDYWVVGVGGKGHIAFHESGIPLDYDMLLVKLDGNTIDNAVQDGHFETKKDAPHYALSMGAGGVVKYSRNVLLLANGERKTEAITDSLLGPETADIPISILQRYTRKKSGSAIYVLDEVAAAGILNKKQVLANKGIELIDARK